MNHFVFRVVRLTLVLLSSAVSFLFVPISAKAQADSIAETIKQLRAIPTSDTPDDLPYEVPVPVRPLLTQLKHQMRDLIAGTLVAKPMGSPEQLRKEVVRRMDALGVRLEEPPKYGLVTMTKPEELQPFTYGGIQDVTFRRPPRHGNLLAAVTTLEVGCGTDSSLYLFERRKPGWELLLAVESNGYEEVNGAQGSFEFGVAPPDKNGDWFVVTTSITPWCTSNWQGFRYSVLKPGPFPYGSMVLLSQHEGIYMGTDEPYRLRVERGAFSVDHIDWFDLDPGLHSRVHLRRFQVKRDSVTRVPPLALYPQDFLDEWVRQPWEEATRWISATNAMKLREIHRRIKEDGTDRRGIGIVQLCPRINRQTWIVSLGDEKPLFFTIEKRHGMFLIRDVAEKQPENCPGNSPPRGRACLP